MNKKLIVIVIVLIAIISVSAIVLINDNTVKNKSTEKSSIGEGSTEEVSTEQNIKIGPVDFNIPLDFVKVNDTDTDEYWGSSFEKEKGSTEWFDINVYKKDMSISEAKKILEEKWKTGYSQDNDFNRGYIEDKTIAGYNGFVLTVSDARYTDLTVKWFYFEKNGKIVRLSTSPASFGEELVASIIS